MKLERKCDLDSTCPGQSLCRDVLCRHLKALLLWDSPAEKSCNATSYLLPPNLLGSRLLFLRETRPIAPGIHLQPDTTTNRAGPQLRSPTGAHSDARGAVSSLRCPSRPATQLTRMSPSTLPSHQHTSNAASSLPCRTPLYRKGEHQKLAGPWQKEGSVPLLPVRHTRVPIPTSDKVQGLIFSLAARKGFPYIFSTREKGRGASDEGASDEGSAPCSKAPAVPPHSIPKPRAVQLNSCLADFFPSLRVRTALCDIPLPATHLSD